jgi:predicted RNA-binding protein with PIN domain
LEVYLEKGELDLTRINGLIKKRKLFPVYFGSALKLSGVTNLLDGIERYGDAAVYDTENFAARVFKIARDNQGNRLTYMKITGSSLMCRQVIAETGEKINQIRIYSGEKYTSIDRADAGMVCAVLGAEKTYAGQGLGKEKAPELPILEPVMTYKVQVDEAIGRGASTDAVTLLSYMKRLEEENPELHVLWDENLKEIHVQIMGQVQLEIIKAVIKERYDINIIFGAGHIVYKETIRKPVVGVGHFEPLRHYSEVHLLMEPLEAGSGLHFDSTCSEDMLDKNWQRLILTHLEEREHKGVLTGSAITDMKITITAGRAHIKHTEGGDFRQATYRAVRQGLMMAESVLLEPVYSFLLDIPQSAVGRAMSDLTRMESSFLPPETAGDRAVIKGKAPVAAMQGYFNEVTAYTKGMGRLTCTMAGYEPCHNADEVIAQMGYEPDTDMDNPSSSVFCAHGAGYLVPWYQVYDFMQVKDDPALVVSKMSDENESTEADNKSRRAYAGQEAYNDDELKEIFEKTYGHSNASEKKWRNSRSKSSGDIIRKAGEKKKPADTGIASPGVFKNNGKQKNYLLVDGYNIIFAWPELSELADESLDMARGKLADILCNYQGYTGCELILVFDAYKVKGGKGEVVKYNNIHIVYTKEAETADMYIEKTTHELGRKHRVVVATSDGLEQLIIMGQGALRMSAAGLKEEIVSMEAEIRDRYLKE